ncbi:MAG: 3-hydroxyacyl-CoA dehydrogenase family protein [Candidatus Brocadia sp.]|nr:3-hydroxyacyl-CoA dehydrogenase family protein [Candidatus Brocadia sp.]
MKDHDIRKIAVVGAGLMGHGIAQEFALAGYKVHLNDLTKEKLKQALKHIQENLQMLMRIGLVTREQVELVQTRLHTSVVLQDAVRDADVVIESVLEDLKLKQKIFQELDTMCPERTILASNTSTMMPGKLASVTRRPGKVLATHYINPPYLMPLVEIVRCQATSDETVTTIFNLLTKIGKRPIVLQKEVPGFVVNRLQGALFREALWLVQKGIVTPQDVDSVMKTSLGLRWAAAGVFEIFEIAGWDFVLAGASELLPHLESSPEVPPLLREKVERGELGVKTGKGFYEWTAESAEFLKQRIAQALVKISQWT